MCAASSTNWGQGVSCGPSLVNHQPAIGICHRFRSSTSGRMRPLVFRLALATRGVHLDCFEIIKQGTVRTHAKSMMRSLVRFPTPQAVLAGPQRALQHQVLRGRMAMFACDLIVQDMVVTRSLRWATGDVRLTAECVSLLAVLDPSGCTSRWMNVQTRQIPWRGLGV